MEKDLETAPHTPTVENGASVRASNSFMNMSLEERMNILCWINENGQSLVGCLFGLYGPWPLCLWETSDAFAQQAIATLGEKIKELEEKCVKN